MDSNGKFLNPEKLFPAQRVTSKRCNNTYQALRLLNQDSFGKPNTIIIHTGTNDLHSQRHRTAEAIKKVAERASMEFPESRTVVSTLLQRTDFPPHIIHDINAELTRSCTALPNVYIAHHPSIGPQDLYDRLHIHKDGVRKFARGLKDVALGQNPTSSQPRPPYPFRYPPPPFMQSNMPFTCWPPSPKHLHPSPHHKAIPQPRKKTPSPTKASHPQERQFIFYCNCTYAFFLH